MTPEAFERLILRAVIDGKCSLRELPKDAIKIGSRMWSVERDGDNVPKETPALRAALTVALAD